MVRENNRKCICCNVQYVYCNTCSEDRNKEPWHAIYHNNNCRKIFMAVTDYLAGEISKEQAKEILDTCDLSNKKNFNGEIPVTINEIYDVEEEKNKDVAHIVEEVVTVSNMQNEASKQLEVYTKHGKNKHK